MHKVSGCSLGEYNQAMENGQPAEMRVWSVLRGGYLYKGNFYYCGITWNVVKSASSLPLEVRVYV